MDSYAIANQKGGVGKSTIALCLAVAFKDTGARTLVIDMDPQAMATKFLGVEPADGTMAEVLCAGWDAAKILQASRWGVDLLPSDISLARLETAGGREPGQEVLLREALHDVHGYDVVLIDCPPQLGLLAINALVAATRLVVVTEPSFAALQGLTDLLHTYELVRRRLNPGLQLAGVIVNVMDHTREARQRVAELREHLGEEVVWEPFVPRRALIREALGRGEAPQRSGGAGAREIAAVFDALAARMTHGR
jgi:chromosome partitioning protein